MPRSHGRDDQGEAQATGPLDERGFGSSLAFGEPSEIFRRVWVPLENALDEESAYVAAKLAALESLRGGFTTVTDAGTRAPVAVGARGSLREFGVPCQGAGVVARDHRAR